MKKVLALAVSLALLLGAVQVSLAPSSVAADPGGNGNGATVTRWDSCETTLDPDLGNVTICDSGRSVATGIESGNGSSCYSETYEDHPELNFRICSSGQGQVLLDKEGDARVVRFQSSGWYQHGGGPICEFSSILHVVDGTVLKDEEFDSCEP